MVNYRGGPLYSLRNIKIMQKMHKKKSGILVQTALIDLSCMLIYNYMKITVKDNNAVIFSIIQNWPSIEYVPGVLKYRDFLGFECKTFHASLLIKCPPLLAMIEANLATPKK